MPSPASLFKRFRAAGTNGVLDRSLLWQASENSPKDHKRYDLGPKIHGKPRIVSLLVGEDQLAECLKVCLKICKGKWSFGVGRRHPMTMEKASFKTLSMKRVRVLQHQTGAQCSAVK